MLSNISIALFWIHICVYDSDVMHQLMFNSELFAIFFYCQMNWKIVLIEVDPFVCFIWASASALNLIGHAVDLLAF